MNLNLVTGYPLWFALLCLVLGIIYAMALYFRERKHEFPKNLVRLMSAFRFLIVSILSFFLLSPLLETINRSTEKPIIIIGQDNSASILNGDSVYYRSGYYKQFNEAIENLRQDYEVRLYTIGENITPVDEAKMDSVNIHFDEKLSDLASFFDEVEIIYSNRNVGAVIFASDGIFNKGISPVYSAANLSYPLYTIGLGDTSIQRDIILKRLNYNRIAFKGNEFPIEVQVNANKCKSHTAVISIVHNGSTIARETLKINNDRFSGAHLFNITAERTGLQRFRVIVSALEDETNARNNFMDAYVDILEAKQKVLILANSPHPDITAIKQALGDNLNYEVKDYLLSEFSEPIDAYNLVVLHQLPSFNPLSARLINELNRSNVPVLYIIGLQTDLSTFNGLKTGLTINFRERNRFSETQAAFNEAFVLFRLSEEEIRSLSLYPPLYSTFGEYNVIRNADILFYQKIGAVTTELPLAMINKSLDKKIAVITGDGIWKWRITNYMRTGNHNTFNRIIDKLVQYLSIQEDKRLFRVHIPQTFYENENVIFDASLYNESYEPVNVPEVELVITSSEGNQYDYNFNKYGEAYTLNAGGFPVGDYQYKARVKLGTKTYSDAGGFSILPLEIELSSTVADHNLMYRLANANNGLMLSDNQIDELPALIRSREDVKPVIYLQKRFTDLINLPWIFVLLVILLAAEWFLRKYAGSY